jgi:hypothetical protein
MELTVTYAIIIIIVLVGLFLCQYNNKTITNEEEYKNISGKPVSMHNDTHKYLFDYDWVFGWWPFWYNKVTPLPFNNPTRYHGYNTTLYPLIHDYYYPRIRYY